MNVGGFAYGVKKDSSAEGPLLTEPRFGFYNEPND